MMDSNVDGLDAPGHGCTYEALELMVVKFLHWLNPIKSLSKLQSRIIYLYPCSSVVCTRMFDIPMPNHKEGHDAQLSTYILMKIGFKKFIYVRSLQMYAFGCIKPE